MAKELEILNIIKAEDVLALSRLLTKNKTTKSKLLYPGKKLNINAQDSDGMSALHQSALMCHVPIMKLLLDNGCTVDIKDQKGMRPLHYAAWQGKTEPVALLLQYNASVNEPSLRGETPLHLAAQHGQVQVASELLRYHANPTIRRNDHKTPLDLACEFGRTQVVECLLQANRCLTLLAENSQDSEDNDRTTCLHLAARNGHLDVIRLLMSSGVEINRSTLRGTALHEAAMHGKLDVVKLLIQCGIDVGKPNSYDQTALDFVKAFTTCNAGREMKQLLKEIINAVQARAIRDYHSEDSTSLPLKEGDMITVLEQNADGRWKGILFRPNHTSQTGYFPATVVQLLDRPVGGLQRTGTLKSSIKKVLPPVVPDISNRHSSSSFSSGYGSQTTADRSSCSSFALDECPLTPAPASPVRDCRHAVIPSPNHHASVFTFSNHQVVVHPRPSSTPTTPNKEGHPFVSGLQGMQASLEDQGIDVSPGRSSPSASSSSTSRHSTSSLDSGRASGSDGKVYISTTPHRVSVQYCTEASVHHRHSYHSSNSSLASADDSSTACNVAELLLHGVGDGEILRAWLSSLHFEEYVLLFVQAGYDMPTISRMTPEDLTAIGITKPAHRRKLKAEIAKLNISDGIPDYKPDSLYDWLKALRLEEYYQTLCQQNYETIDKVTDLQWEDLEEIGIKKLGHQKKIMLAVKRVKTISQWANRIPDMHSKELPATLPRPSSLGHGSNCHYHSQEVAINTTRCRSSPSSESALNTLEFKTFQQSPPKYEGGFHCHSNGDLSAHHLLCQADLVTVQVRSPNRGRSLESLDMEDSVSVISNQLPENWGGYESNRQQGYDTDGDVGSLFYEMDTTSTLHRPKGMVKPRPVAKIIAKTRWSEPDVSIDKNGFESDKALIKDCVDGWSSLEGTPRHLPRSNGGSCDIYATLKGKRTPPPPPKRTNSIHKSDRHAENTSPPMADHAGSIQAMKDKAFATCVMGLASRFNMTTKGRSGEEEEVALTPSSDREIPSPAPSEEFPPPPSPLPSAVESMADSFYDRYPTDPYLMPFGQKQRRKDSADSNTSNSSSESNTLPFANENVGTIKQKATKSSPSTDGDSCSYLSAHCMAGPAGGQRCLMPKPNFSVHGSVEHTGAQSLQSGDVIDDIENMLTKLSNQLDAMLESEMNS